MTDLSAQTHRSAPAQAPAPTPAPTQMAPPPTAAGRARSRRLPKEFKFKGFEEEYNGPSAYVPIPESMEVDSTPAIESQSLFVSQDSRNDLEDTPPTERQRNGRKRDTPPVDYDDGQDIMDDVAPASQAFKKRKLADEVARRRRGESTPPPAVQPKVVAKPQTKSKGVRKEINVQEFLAEKAEKEAEAAQKAEELARAEREALEEQLDGMPIEDIRNLAIIEEMTVTRQAPPPRTVAHADESDRWDERWNGRRNFKKFRRRGADPNDRRGPSRVIVQLEEVKKKDFGIGDEYWLEDAETQRRKKKGKGRETQDTQSRGRSRQQAQAVRVRVVDASGAEEDDDLTPQRDENRREPATSDVEEVAPSRKPADRHQRGTKLADKTNESQNLPTQRGKRAAAAPLTKPAPAKKVKAAPVAAEASDDDSDDDGLKFRFARRN